MNTALGGQWRLMAHRMKKGMDDGEEDEEGAGVIEDADDADDAADDDADADGDGDGWGGDDGYNDGDGEAVIRGVGSQAGVLGRDSTLTPHVDRLHSTMFQTPHHQ